MRRPGALLASGRDSDIFECGPGLVLRRSRKGNSMEREARTMEYVRTHGYPVPAIDEISDDGTDLVMERIDGPSLLADLSRRPWRIRAHGRLIGDLLAELHELSAPDWVPESPAGSGDRLLHMDLHPLNVIMSARGPVVIDWPNACRGDPATDVAVSWVLMACAGIPTGRIEARVLGVGRQWLVSSMLSRFDLAELRPQLAPVVDWKTADANMTDVEVDAMRSFARRQVGSGR